MPYLLLGVALCAGLILASRWFVSADPKTLVKILKPVLLALIVAVIIAFAASGLLNWAFAGLFALLPWILRAVRVARTAKTFSQMGGGGSSGSSDVETRFLRMHLDHGSGEMDGEVLQGPFVGRQLSSLGLDDLTALLESCREEDEPSARILETYLDRHWQDWRENHAPSSAEGPMSRAEAARILGVDEDADAEEIKEAHRKLMAGVHPDQGGSTYLATKINQARDLLLRS